MDSRSFGDPLTKHELLYVLSLPKDETFISPDKHIELTKFGADFFQRHGYPYSGRSFSKGFLHKEKLYEFVIKGGHLLRDGEIYYPNKQIWASPAWGCETVQQSYNEFIAARDIQSLYLQVF